MTLTERLKSWVLNKFGNHLVNEELRLERDYSSLIMQGTPSVIVGINPEGMTLFVNPAMEAVSGYRKEEMIGQNYWRLFYPGDEYQQVEQLFVDFQKGPVRDYPMTLTTKTGDKKIVAWNSLNRFNSKGELVEVIGFGNDITERTRVERELKAQQAIAAASSKMSALGEMAAGIAHEINTPLATIAMTAGQISDMVEENTLSPEFLKKASQAIETTCFRISKTIKALKTFSRNGNHDPYSNTSLNSILDDTLTLCHEKLKHRSIKLELQPIPENIKVICQSVQISQVVLNLLNNAIDAVEPLPNKWIRIEYKESKLYHEIAITDSGSGISKELAHKIMDPFFTTKETGKGTGLGLSISKGIIETHNGKLTLDTKSANTKFVISLPKSRQLPDQVQMAA